MMSSSTIASPAFFSERFTVFSVEHGRLVFIIWPGITGGRMQPRSLPSLKAPQIRTGVPDEHDVRRQIALSLYIYKELRGLDVDVVPSKWDLDKETQNYYLELVK